MDTVSYFSFREQFNALVIVLEDFVERLVLGDTFVDCVILEGTFTEVMLEDIGDVIAVELE